MELIVFDLDGTLLNRQQKITDYTRETLELLGKQHIAYTIATGRTLHAAKPCLDGHQFALPHVYKNGVMIWDPTTSLFRHHNVLTKAEINTVLHAFTHSGLTPFVCTLEPNDEHAVYHPPILDAAGHEMVFKMSETRHLPVFPLTALDSEAR
ncbi:MAG: HAD-IIB family hydrolase, partial [Natronospirillum sp.]